MQQQLTMKMKQKFGDTPIGISQVYSHYVEDFDDQPLTWSLPTLWDKWIANCFHVLNKHTYDRKNDDVEF